MREREEPGSRDGAHDERGEGERRLAAPVAIPAEAPQHRASVSSFGPRRNSYNEGRCRFDIPRDEHSPHPASRRASDIARLHRPGRLARPVPAAPRRVQGLSRRGVGARPHDGPHAEGLRHRNRCAPSGSPPPVSQLARHREAIPARAHSLRRRKGRRGLDVPQDTRRRAGRTGPGGGRRSPHPLGQHVRVPRGRRPPPRLHHQRALLRHRDVRRARLRGRCRGSRAPRRAHHRRSSSSGSARIPSGCSAPANSRHASRSRCPRTCAPPSPSSSARS